MLMKILFGTWLSLSIMLNAFGVWIGRIWNDSNPLWVLGFPLLVLVVVGCSMLGIFKGRWYLISLGLATYPVLWVGLAFDGWGVPILIVSAVNLVLIGLAAKKLGTIDGPLLSG